MSKRMSTVKRFIVEDEAAEVTELAIVLALIIAGAIASIALLGPKVQQGFIDTNADL